jgi:putative membrane protein
VWLSALVAALHYLALAIGLPAVFLRGRALRGRLDVDGLRRVFTADGVWGIAALLWITTGIARAFAGLEKGTAFYLQSPLFRLKMGLFLAILALEIWPMVTFIRWRRARSKGHPPKTARAPALARVNDVETGLVVLIVFVATAMARGLLVDG